MSSKRLAFRILASMVVSTTAFAFQPFTGSTTWQGSNLLPESSTASQMHQLGQEIADDLNSGGGKYTLQYKKPGGSSHQTLVIRVSDGAAVGLWSAPNHATYIEGEIFAYNLARLLGRADWVGAGMRMTLTGKGLATARKANQPAETPKARACNKEHILTYMKANPHYITGLFKPFEPGKKPDSIPEIVDRVNQKRLNAKHFIVAMTSKNGPQPKNDEVFLSSAKTLSYKKMASGRADLGHAKDTDLAKQLSFMTLVDALNSQRDRFGPYGSNLEAFLDSKGGVMTIAAVDNGGISDSANTSSLAYFLASTTRFEREVMEKVIELDSFVKGQTSSFQGFRTVAELQEAIGLELDLKQDDVMPKPSSSVCRSTYTQLYAAYGKRMSVRWNNFVKALDLVAGHMRKLQNDRGATFD